MTWSHTMSSILLIYILPLLSSKWSYLTMMLLQLLSVAFCYKVSLAKSSRSSLPNTTVHYISSGKSVVVSTRTLTLSKILKMSNSSWAKIELFSVNWYSFVIFLNSSSLSPGFNFVLTLSEISYLTWATITISSSKKITESIRGSSLSLILWCRLTSSI